MGNNILGVFLWTAIYVKKDCHNKNSLTWISYLMLPSSLQNNYFSNIIIQEQLPLCKNDAAKMDFVPIRRVAYIKTAYKICSHLNSIHLSLFMDFLRFWWVCEAFSRNMIWSVKHHSRWWMKYPEPFFAPIYEKQYLQKLFMRFVQLNSLE